MIVPFKKPAANSPPCRVFNATLSFRRIAIEHVFGMLKSHFPSITCVPIRVTGMETHKQVVDWLESACILHNFLLQVNDDEWMLDGEEREKNRVEIEIRRVLTKWRRG